MARQDYLRSNISHLTIIALMIFLGFIKNFMKKSHRPITKVKNPEPKVDSPNWVIWAAWADRITFEYIKKKTGKTESDVIKIMRKNLKPRSFKNWRKRVSGRKSKHEKKNKILEKSIHSTK